MHQNRCLMLLQKVTRGHGINAGSPSTAKFITSSKDVKRNNANILKVPEINLEVGQEYIEYLLGLEIVSNNLIYLALHTMETWKFKKMEARNKFLEDPILYGKHSFSRNALVY